MAYKSREDLLERTMKVFSDQPEVRQITMFGRTAEGTADEYSDLDIRVHSNDPLATQEKYVDVFREICPIRETFLLASDANNFAQSIMLEDYSPYQKVDFGICAGDSPFSPTISLYQNDQPRLVESKMRVVPIVQDVKYELTNYLFGVAPTMKCFFRRDFDLYRRWQVNINPALVLLFEKYNGFQLVTQKKALGAHEAKQLFSIANPEDIAVLERIFPKNARLDVLDSYMVALNLYVTLSKEKAKHFGIVLNDGFISYIEQFAREESEKVARVL